MCGWDVESSLLRTDAVDHDEGGIDLPEAHHDYVEQRNRRAAEPCLHPELQVLPDDEEEYETDDRDDGESNPHNRIDSQNLCCSNHPTIVATRGVSVAKAAMDIADLQLTINDFQNDDLAT